MQTIVAKALVATLALIVSAVTHIRLPVLGPTPVLGVLALAIALTAAAVLLASGRSLWQARPRTVAS